MKTDDTFESFEKAMDTLKATVEKLEREKPLDLDELINNYEIGMKAYNFCIDKLEKTQNKIHMIENNL